MKAYAQDARSGAGFIQERWSQDRPIKKDCHDPIAEDKVVTNTRICIGVLHMTIANKRVVRALEYTVHNSIYFYDPVLSLT